MMCAASDSEKPLSRNWQASETGIIPAIPVAHHIEGGRDQSILYIASGFRDWLARRPPRVFRSRFVGQHQSPQFLRQLFKIVKVIEGSELLI